MGLCGVGILYQITYNYWAFGFAQESRRYVSMIRHDDAVLLLDEDAGDYGRWELWILSDHPSKIEIVYSCGVFVYQSASRYITY